MMREGLKILKTWHRPFNDVWEGRKTHELRLDDRRFQAGDIITLLEFDNGGGVASGRRIIAQVTHVLHGGEFPGLVHGFVILSLFIKHRLEAHEQTNPEHHEFGGKEIHV